MKKVSFIAINIVLITLSILSIIYDYSAFAILTLPALFLAYIFKYLNHIQKYPLNELREYRFRVLQDEFALYNEKDNCYYINVYNCNGIYKATDCKKQMIFDMGKCIFPKSYLRAYFVRNIHFLILRKRKLSLRYLSKRLKVWDKFKYKNLKIVFIKRKQKKRILNS